MGEHVKLRAADGFELDAYVARPAGAPVAGLVVVQEAFGVNHHIREVTDGWAKDGFLAVAPALFDRVQRGVELGYGPEDLQKGMAIIQKGDTDDRVKDVAAAMDYARRETGKKVGVIGYCLGGSMAWLAATRLNPDAAVGYYGSMIAQYARRRSAGAGDAALRRGRYAYSEGARSMRRWRRRIRRCRFTGMRGRGTGLIRAIARATTRRRRSWHGSGRWSFWKKQLSA